MSRIYKFRPWALAKLTRQASAVDKVVVCDWCLSLARGGWNLYCAGMDYSKFFPLVAVGLLLGLAGCATTERSGGGPMTAARDRTVQLQIFLDSENFGPGIVDGQDGEFTVKALQAYRQAKGLPEGFMPDTSMVVPYTTTVVTAEDLAVLGTMAEEPADIAKQKRLPYVGLGELLAERYHTSRGFLAQLNPGKSIDEVPVGTVLRVPNVVRPFRVESFPGSYRPAPSSVAAGRLVVIDTSVRMLGVSEGGRLIAAFPITPGSAEHPAPAGQWKIAMSVPWPTFRYDEGVLKRGERTKDFHMFPAGPNSPVGILWAGLNRPGTGIHGTAYPEIIGRSGSHGCIRLANWDAAKFYTMVGPGTPVTIR